KRREAAPRLPGGGGRERSQCPDPMPARAASGASSTIGSMELAAGDEIRPADVAAAAARSLLRGRTVEALARELAWSAVRAAGFAHDQIDRLVPMVDAQLTLRFEEV